MSYQHIPGIENCIMNKPFPIICIYQVLPPFGGYPLLYSMPVNNFPQVPLSASPAQGTTQDNCIIIEDENQQQPTQASSSTVPPLLGQLQSGQEARVARVEKRESTRQPVDEVDEFSPYIRIHMFKQHQTQNTRQFILQHDSYFRIIGRQHGKGGIIIGRKKQQNDDNHIDCEIGLPHNDKNVEREHCKILTEKGFLHSSKLTIQAIYFFYLVKNDRRMRGFNFTVVQKIYSFIKERPQFFIEDLGTSQGTYMRIKKEKPRLIEQDNSYLIGADTQFHVLYLNAKRSKLRQPKDTNYLIETLVRENQKRNVEIHGLSPEEKDQFEKSLAAYNTIKQRGRKHYRIQSCDRPMLKLQFNSSHLTYTHIFVAEYDRDQLFKVGRSQECDVVVNINTVSRKQAQIVFRNNEWLMYDGEGQRESANGTWQRLSQSKTQSSTVAIEDQMEVKVSENILKFDFVNFGVTKKRKLNNEEILNLISSS